MLKHPIFCRFLLPESSKIILSAASTICNICFKNNLSGADLDILSFHEKNIALIHIYGDSIYDTLTKSDIV